MPCSDGLLPARRSLEDAVEGLFLALLLSLLFISSTLASLHLHVFHYIVSSVLFILLRR